MDKKEQGRIAVGLISDDAMNGLSFLTDNDRTPTWLELDRFIRALGYRKLPKDKPLLLTKEELEEILWQYHKKLPNQSRASFIAQAQREADIKHYEGG